MPTGTVLIAVRNRSDNAYAAASGTGESKLLGHWPIIQPPSIRKREVTLVYEPGPGLLIANRLRKGNAPNPGQGFIKSSPTSLCSD